MKREEVEVASRRVLKEVAVDVEAKTVEKASTLKKTKKNLPDKCSTLTVEEEAEVVVEMPLKILKIKPKLKNNPRWMSTVWKLLLNLVVDVAEVRIRTEMTDLANRIRRVRPKVKEKKAINREDALNAMAKAKLMRRVKKTAEVVVEDEPIEAEEVSSLLKVLVAPVSKLELAVVEVANKFLELKTVITKKLDWCTERWIKSLKAMLTVQCRSKAAVLEPLKCKRRQALSRTLSTIRTSSQLSRVATPIETN
jgi:hypothetical protein